MNVQRAEKSGGVRYELEQGLPKIVMRGALAEEILQHRDPGRRPR